MPHSYTSMLMHCVFSTKERQPAILPEFRDRLWAFMGGIARKNNLKALAVGGVADHAHMLLSLPSTITVAKALQLIKGGSSKWVHETFPGQRAFAWQEGYGAFSVGISQVAATVAYIRNQEEHHRTRGFEEEFLLFLSKHGLTYDDRRTWT